MQPAGFIMTINFIDWKSDAKVSGFRDGLAAAFSLDRTSKLNFLPRLHSICRCRSVDATLKSHVRRGSACERHNGPEQREHHGTPSQSLQKMSPKSAGVVTIAFF